MTRETTPAAAEYLSRLEWMLRGADAATRRDVMAGVAEHLADAETRGGAAVYAAIERLGPPEAVASAALPEPRSSGGKGISAAGVWVSAAIVALSVAGFGLLAAGLALTAHFDDDAEWNLPALAVFLGAVAVGTLAVLGLILASMSRGLTGREKLALSLVTGIAAALFFASEPVALALPEGWGFAISPALLIASAILVAIVARLALIAARR